MSIIKSLFINFFCIAGNLFIINEGAGFSPVVEIGEQLVKTHMKITALVKLTLAEETIKATKG